MNPTSTALDPAVFAGKKAGEVRGTGTLGLVVDRPLAEVCSCRAAPVRWT